MKFKYTQQEVPYKRDIASIIQCHVNCGWEYVETIIIPDNGPYSYNIILIFRKPA